MQTSFRSALVSFAATAVMCIPGLSMAALTPVDAITLSAQAPDSDPYAVHADNLLVGIAPPQALKVGEEEMRPVMRSALASKPLLLELRGPSDLALWNLIATVHAQQRNNVFDLVDTGANTVREIEREQVSPVPLPGVLWLFVMGLLGLAGTRVQRRVEKSPALGAAVMA